MAFPAIKQLLSVFRWTHSLWPSWGNPKQLTGFKIQWLTNSQRKLRNGGQRGFRSRSSNCLHFWGTAIRDWTWSKCQSTVMTLRLNHWVLQAMLDVHYFVQSIPYLSFVQSIPYLSFFLSVSFVKKYFPKHLPAFCCNVLTYMPYMYMFVGKISVTSVLKFMMYSNECWQWNIYLLMTMLGA